jgi:hypothetical protein
MAELQEDIEILSNLIKFLHKSKAFDTVQYIVLNNIILKCYDDFQKRLVQSIGNNCYIESCNKEGIITLILNNMIFKLSPSEGEIESIINLRVHSFESDVD